MRALANAAYEAPDRVRRDCVARRRDVIVPLVKFLDTLSTAVDMCAPLTVRRA